MASLDGNHPLCHALETAKQATRDCRSGEDEQDTEAFSAAAKALPGYQTLGQAALDYAEQGVTSVKEVLRISEVVADTATY